MSVSEECVAEERACKMDCEWSRVKDDNDDVDARPPSVNYSMTTTAKNDTLRYFTAA